MKTEVKKIDGTKRQINIEVSGEVVKNKFEDVFNRINKEAKVSGFRPGHVPRDILEKHYSSHAHEQVLKELVPDIYNQAIEKEGLDVVELPSISEVKLDRNSLFFRADVEVSPEIKLGNYKGVKVEYQKPSVSADEIKRSIDAIKEARKVEAVDDGIARCLGYPDVGELENAIQQQIFLQKDNAQRQKIESQIIQSLTKDLDFKAPSSMVKRQLEDLVKQAKVDLAIRGLPREKIQEQEQKLNEELQPEAKRQVEVYLVLSEVAKRENIPQDEHMPRKVMEFLLKEATWQVNQ